MNASSPTVSSSSRGTLRLSRRGKTNSILLVAFHRPHVKNAIDDNVYADLTEILHETATDPTISALVLTGTGHIFTSGADLKGKSFEPNANKGGTQFLQQVVGKFMMAMISYPKLLAAAVNGPAIGIGTTLLFHCDLVYCTPNALFWTPFSRLAFVPEFCSSETMVHRMGLAKANEFLLLGKPIGAQTAVDWNICSRVVPSKTGSAMQGGDDLDKDLDMETGDPFHPNSLASKMCREIDERLLSLPLGSKTLEYYVSMVRGRHARAMKSVCIEELDLLGERFDTGQVAIAASQVVISPDKQKQKKKGIVENKPSKL